MNRGKVLLPVIAFLLLAGGGQASDVATVLNQAKKDGKLVMLELGSVGCMPCEQMKPVMEKLRTTYKDRLEVLFVDVRKDHETARRFNVHIIPVQVFLDRNSREFHRHMGFYSYEEISAMLNKSGR